MLQVRVRHVRQGCRARQPVLVVADDDPRLNAHALGGRDDRRAEVRGRPVEDDSEDLLRPAERLRGRARSVRVPVAEKRGGTVARCCRETCPRGRARLPAGRAAGAASRGTRTGSGAGRPSRESTTKPVCSPSGASPVAAALTSSVAGTPTDAGTVSATPVVRTLLDDLHLPRASVPVTLERERAGDRRAAGRDVQEPEGEALRSGEDLGLGCGDRDRPRRPPVSSWAPRRTALRRRRPASR